MKFITVALAAMAAALVSGCVVAPLGVRPVAVYPANVQPVYAQQEFAPPPGVVYVQPTYVLPAPGYVWGYHPHYGWGYRHPQYGWHRGWR